MNYFDKPYVYGAKHKDEKIRINSRSGGVFTAVSDYILDCGGIVYGCVMENCVDATHKRAQTKEERDKMRGSKYIQSSINDTYNLVKKDVDSDRKVIFSGTPCEIAGLQTFLGNSKDKVIYVDIACHGVPSPRVWKDYVMWREEKHRGKCNKVDFRDKIHYGWSAHIETLFFVKKNGTTVRISDDVFANLFYSHEVLRPSCFECPYKSIDRKSDITLADFWGISKVNAEFNDNKGVSLILINTEEGFEIFNRIKDKLDCFPTSIDDNSMQAAFQRPWPIPKTRADFWRNYNKRDFEFIARRYGKYGLIAHVRKRVKRCLIKLKKTKNQLLNTF